VWIVDEVLCDMDDYCTHEEAKMMIGMNFTSCKLGIVSFLTFEEVGWRMDGRKERVWVIFV
jgi:hypothetical protein